MLSGRAALFVDGRYTLQARNEVDGALYECRHATDAPLSDRNLKRVAARAMLALGSTWTAHSVCGPLPRPRVRR